MKNAIINIQVAVFLWGFTGILGKLITLNAPVLVWWRMLIAASIMAVILTLQKGWIKYPKKDFLKIIGIGLLFAAHWILFFGAIKLANASIAMICLASASVFISLLEPLINKTPFKIKELTLGLVALLGVLCIYIFQPENIKTEYQMVNFDLGLLFGILAAILSAVFTIFNKPISEKYPAKPTVFLEMCSGFVGISILGLFFYEAESNASILPQGMDWLWLLLLSYFCTVLAQSLALKSLKVLDAFTTTISVNLEPIYGIILAVIILKENNQFGWGTYLGMSLIILSLALQVRSILKQNKTKKLANTQL